jgi:hypothetical protein
MDESARGWVVVEISDAWRMCSVQLYAVLVAGLFIFQSTNLYMVFFFSLFGFPWQYSVLYGKPIGYMPGCTS